MSVSNRWAICGCAAAILATISVLSHSASLAHAQTGRAPGHPGLCQVVRGNQKVLVAPTVQPRQMPPRTPFTAAEDQAATIPGMPDNTRLESPRAPLAAR
jgi:hypothetical protein